MAARQGLTPAARKTAADKAAAPSFRWREDRERLVGTFDTWQGWLNYATQDPADHLGEGRYWAGSRRDETGERDPWSGTHTWQEAEDLARSGYRGAVLQAEAVAHRVAYQVIGERLSTEWTFPRDLTGDALDVATFLTGEPECFVAPLPEEAPRIGGVVRLLVPVSADHTVPESLYRARGAAIVGLIEVLAKAGHSLEVWTHSGHSGRVALCVKVQHAADAVDFGRIMFGVGHPAMLRRLVFSALERLPAKVRQSIGVPRGGYGTPMEADPADLPECSGPTIRLPRLTARDDWSEEAARRWIMECLDNLAGQ